MDYTCLPSNYVLNLMSMQVEVSVEFSRAPMLRDFRQVLSAVESLAVNKSSLAVDTSRETNTIRVAFDTPNSKQVEIVDHLAHAFRTYVTHYADFAIRFPKQEKISNQQGPTAKQAQYLEFIEGYTKIHGKSPSQMEIQRHFKVTPYTVHQMILQLEKRGFVTRVPGASRSLQLVSSIIHLDA